MYEFANKSTLAVPVVSFPNVKVKTPSAVQVNNINASK
jgi:hypothetical protein